MKGRFEPGMTRSFEGKAIKGFRGEDAKEKANTMKAYWVPGVNNLKNFGRWDFAELTDGLAIEDDFNSLVEKLCATDNADQTAAKEG